MLSVRLAEAFERTATAAAVVLAPAELSAGSVLESAAMAAVAVRGQSGTSTALSVVLVVDTSCRTCTGFAVAEEGTAGLFCC